MENEIQSMEKLLEDLVKLEDDITSFKERIEAGFPAELRVNVNVALRNLIPLLVNVKAELESVRVTIETELLDQDVQDSTYDIQIKEEVKDLDEVPEADLLACGYKEADLPRTIRNGFVAGCNKRRGMSPVVLLQRIDNGLKVKRRRVEREVQGNEAQVAFETGNELIKNVKEEVEDYDNEANAESDFEYEPNESNSEGEAEWEEAEFHCSEQEGGEESATDERDPLACFENEEEEEGNEKGKSRRRRAVSPATREKRRNRYENRGAWKGPGTRLEWFVIPPSVKDEEGRILCIAKECTWKGARRQAFVTHLKVSHKKLLEDKFYKIQTLVLKLLEDITIDEESQLYACIYPDCDYCFKARNKREVHRHMRRVHPHFLKEKYNIDVLPGEDGYSDAVLKARKNDDRNVFRLLADLESNFDVKSGKFQCLFPGCQCGAMAKGQTHRHMRMMHPAFLLRKYGIEVEKRIRGMMIMAECEICSASILQKNMAQHLTTHDETKAFVCEVCGNRFKRKENLKYHLENSHRKEGEEEEGFLCTECGAKLKNKNGLKTHMRRIHLLGDHRPHKCDLCEFAFKQKSHLRDHMKIHVKKSAKAVKQDSEQSDS